MSGSCWRSRKAENSNIQSLELATLRPCHGEAGGAEGDGVGPAGDSKPKRRERDTWNLPLLVLPADVLSEDWRKPVECAQRQDRACERSGSVIPGFCAGPCSGQMDSEQPRLPGKLPEQALQDSRPRAISSPGRKTAS